MDIIKDIDFKLILGKKSDKVFQFYQEDGTAYDFSGSTVLCKVLITPESPTEIIVTIDVVNGKITISFESTLFSSVGIYEYVIEETKADTTVIPLVRGNINVSLYTPFSETIEAYLRSELPASITLTEDYVNQRIFYWRRLLYKAFEIAEADINIEGSWPVLANALLAKLVVYDAMMLAMSGSLMGFFGGDYTQSTTTGGGIKSIQTGPAKVEFHPLGDGLGELLKKSKDGVSPFDILISSLCGLANHLGVKVPMCQFRKTIHIPKFYTNEDWAYPSLADDEPISRA